MSLYVKCEPSRLPMVFVSYHIDVINLPCPIVFCFLLILKSFKNMTIDNTQLILPLCMDQASIKIHFVHLFFLMDLNLKEQIPVFKSGKIMNMSM